MLNKIKGIFKKEIEIELEVTKGIYFTVKSIVSPYITKGNYMSIDAREEQIKIKAIVKENDLGSLKKIFNNMNEINSEDYVKMVG